MLRRIALMGALAATAVLGLAGSAWAHVTVDPLSVPQGSTVKLSFLAPNEDPAHLFTELQVFFPVPPADPIPTVTVEPKAGWTINVTNKTLAKPIVTDDGNITSIVSEIDWKAKTPADAIGKDQFGEFVIDADGIPDHGSEVVFKALQTYSNGNVVRWIEPIPKTGDEPEHPTPVLQLTSASSDSGTPAATTPTASTTSSKDNSARTLGIIAIILGALALAASALGLTRRSGAGGATSPS